MTLHIRYEYLCDFCQQEIRPKDEYMIEPFCYAQDMSIPEPRHYGMAVDQYMACNLCRVAALNAAKECGDSRNG